MANNNVFKNAAQGIGRLLKGPYGAFMTAAVIDAAVNGSIRPVIQTKGMDMNVSMTQAGLNGPVQIDFAQQKIGQITLLYQPPRNVEVQPAQMTPVSDLWANIKKAQDLIDEES